LGKKWGKSLSDFSQILDFFINITVEAAGVEPLLRVLGTRHKDLILLIILDGYLKFLSGMSPFKYSRVQPSSVHMGKVWGKSKKSLVEWHATKIRTLF